jgi:hypothetical protein
VGIGMMMQTSCDDAKSEAAGSEGPHSHSWNMRNGGSQWAVLSGCLSFPSELCLVGNIRLLWKIVLKVADWLGGLAVLLGLGGPQGLTAL